MSESEAIENEVNEPKEGLSESQTQELEALQPDYVPEDEKPQGPSSADVLGMVISNIYLIAGTLLCKSMGVEDGEKIWHLSKAEVEAIAVPADQCIKQYFPDYEASPLVALGAGVVMVTAPRMMMTRQLAEEVKDNGDQSQSLAA